MTARSVAVAFLLGLAFAAMLGAGVGFNDTKPLPIPYNIDLPTDDAVDPFHYAYSPETIVAIWCQVDPTDSGESVSIVPKECDGAGINCVAMGPAIVCDNNGTYTAAATLTDTVVAQGSEYAIDKGAVTTAGTVSRLRIITWVLR